MLGSKQSFCHEYHHMWIYWAQHTCKTYLQIKYVGLHFAMPQYVLHVLHAPSPNEISRVQPWRLWLSSMQTNKSFMQALSQVVFVRRADSGNLWFAFFSVHRLILYSFTISHLSRHIGSQLIWPSFQLLLQILDCRLTNSTPVLNSLRAKAHVMPSEKR